MDNLAAKAKIEEIKEIISKRFLAPNQIIVDTYENFAIIMKPFKNPYGLERHLKNPLKFDDINARILRHQKAISNVGKSKYGIRRLLLKQEFVCCHAKDGTPYVVKITELRHAVRTMAENPLISICKNRKYVKALVDVSFFALSQLILYGRKYDLLGGTENPLSLNILRFFISTLKSKNVFTGINPDTGKEEIFIDADSYIQVCESKLPVAKAILSALFWMRNAAFYYFMLCLHKINVFTRRRNNEYYAK
ncbi:MAG TPA: hypothetical protein P5294_06660 [Smithellaceae bacterium]|nr:hypothetical protein [Smithellaceae bacterium]HRS89391.1 hypothetical protein [Smithellaceae bacterium]HRV26199.1 hypothetical protein [Smithellaceae bacterium]